VGFEELLRQKLGPMRDLVQRGSTSSPPTYDPAALFYRRALGVEARVRTDDTWASAELCGPNGKWTRHDMEDLQNIAGMTRWTAASEAGPRATKLWRWAEQGLLYFAREDPRVGLTGRTDVLEGSGPITRRWGVWARPAMENAVQISPVPFMPRGRDLQAAELVGYRLSSRERGHEVLGVSITGGTGTGKGLRALMPLLDGTRSHPEILEAVGEELRAEATRLLRLLDRVTALDEDAGPTALRSELARRADQVTWLGHAGVLYQSRGVSILIDPFFGPPSDPPERWLSTPQFDPRALPPIDAVLITHGDNDHLNPASLALLPSSTPVFVPRLVDRPAPYEVDIRGMLRLLGFERVTEVDPWAGVAIGDVTVTAVPFRGEDWGLDLPQATWHVESAELAIYCSADSAPMDDVYRQLGDRRRIDLAFMGVGGCAESYGGPADLGYGNFYRDWVPVVQHNEWVQHCAGPADAVHALEIFKPRFAFGYAAGGASWIPVAYSDTGDHEQMADRLDAARNQAFDTLPVSLPLGRPVRASELSRGSVTAT